jgi:hypothetical protein
MKQRIFSKKLTFLKMRPQGVPLPGRDASRRTRNFSLRLKRASGGDLAAAAVFGIASGAQPVCESLKP